MRVNITHIDKKGNVTEFPHTVDEFGVVRNKYDKVMSVRDTGTRATITLYKKKETYTIGLADLVRRNFNKEIEGKIGFKNSKYMDCRASNICEDESIKRRIRAIRATELLSDSEISRALRVTKQYVNQV
jgi:hypothetical protein